MRTYKRAYRYGGSYFFTAVTYGRQHLLTGHDAIARLQLAFKHIMATRPFIIDAIVVLPDHMHCIWTLPANDHDFSTRWMLIKKYFSIGIDVPGNARREKAVWQPRFWEHLIRDDGDWQRHMDYIHYNPVRHGYAVRPFDWPHSSFKKVVADGLYDDHWGWQEPTTICDMDLE